MVSKSFDPKALLEKHGWKFGSGLGKGEGGIKEAIKVELKMDRAGMGYDASEKYSFQWWDHVFNTAANSIEVVSDENGVSIKKTSSFDVSTKKKSKVNQTKPKTYGCFVKSATLTNDGIEVKESGSDSDSSSDSDAGIISKMTDEELFKACGGMTGHKGARHGLNLRGKLLRIQQHDEQFLRSQKMQNGSKPIGNSATSVPENVNTKTEASEEKSKEVKNLPMSSNGQGETSALSPSGQGNGVMKRNKRRKRDRDDRKDVTEENAKNEVDCRPSTEETTAKKPKCKNKRKTDDLGRGEEESSRIEDEEMTSLKLRKKKKKNTKCDEHIVVLSGAASDKEFVSLDELKAGMKATKKTIHHKVCSHGGKKSSVREEQSMDQSEQITENSKTISKKLKKKKEQENEEKQQQQQNKEKEPLSDKISVMNQTEEIETDGSNEQKQKSKKNKKNQDKEPMCSMINITYQPVEGTSMEKNKCKKHKKKIQGKEAMSSEFSVMDQPEEDTGLQKKRCKKSRKNENDKKACMDEFANHTEELTTEESKIQNKKCKKSREKKLTKETGTDEMMSQTEQLGAQESKLQKKKCEKIKKDADETGPVLRAPESTDRNKDSKTISKKSKKCKRKREYKERDLKEHSKNFHKVCDSEEATISSRLELENHTLHSKEKRQKNGCVDRVGKTTDCEINNTSH